MPAETKSKKPIRLSKHAKEMIGQNIYITWGVSRGRDSYGYTTCVLRDAADNKIASCNGGGYDMKGTVVGHWITATFEAELLKLKEADMPSRSHWKYSETSRRVCRNNDCTVERSYFGHEVDSCPHCGARTHSTGDGETIDDGHSFYGLRYYNPNYDPGKAKIGKDCTDRTVETSVKSMTVEEAEKAGKSFGLERLQAAYRETSSFPTRKHRKPYIDGACGFNCVVDILNAIGLTLVAVDTKRKKLDIYTIAKFTDNRY